MKDFENDLIYYPHPDPIEPRFILNSMRNWKNQQNTVSSVTERNAWCIIQTPLIMLS